jgi:hypothetical protein
MSVKSVIDRTALLEGLSYNSSTIRHRRSLVDSRRKLNHPPSQQEQMCCHSGPGDARTGAGKPAPVDAS